MPRWGGNMAAHFWVRPVGLAISLMLAGCGETDLIFVTSTTGGVNLDTTTQQLSIGYDRTEGYLGPRFSDGSVVPALASFHGTASAKNQNVRDLFAAGDAAVTIAKGTAATSPELPAGSYETASKGRVFVGTSTNAGLKVGFDGPNAVTVNVGYRRNVLGVISPGVITRNNTSTLVYPSVIASVDAAASVSTPDATESTVSQFLLVGKAADEAAQKPGSAVTAGFAEDATKAFMGDKWLKTAEAERAAAEELLACYDEGILKAPLDKRDEFRAKFWKDSADAGIFPNTDDQMGMLNEISAPMPGDPVAADINFRSSLMVPSGNGDRAYKIKKLYDSVCGNKEGDE